MRNLMRNLVLALGMVVCTNAFSADWAAVPTGDGNQHYYDRSKVFVSGDEVVYWRRVVFSTAHPVKGGFARSAMYRERIQCKQYRITTYGYLLYSSDGSVLENVYTPEAEASAIVPETVGERFQRIMCAMLATPVATPAETPPPQKATPPKKTDGSDDLRQEIDRLEQMLKRLRDRLGEKQN